MRICLLTDQDLDRDPFPEDDWPCDPRPFLPDAEWEVATLEIDSSVATVTRRAQRDFDLFFNLCDGARDEGRPGIEVVRTLERLDVPFTGASSGFFEPSREAMKRVCAAWELDTPAYTFVRDGDDIERALDRLRFPLFVKHPSSYASVGLTRKSRVETPAALREQVHAMRESYGAALVEEYVEGAECTVLVAEGPEDRGAPTTYVPIRYHFPEGEAFKHSDLKWVDYHGLRAEPVEDAALAERLRSDSADLFTGLGGVGYGRCDFRVDADGRSFLLEINPNCGLYYPPEDAGSADLILQHDPAGHRGFTEQIVEAAFARHRRRRRGWEVRPLVNGGHGIFAVRPFAPGDRILVFEERPHTLVSLSRVEKGWGARERDWFDRYAWPLTDEIWAVWSEDPDEWRPINHSCEPAAWVEGLDVVARRAVEAGEEITLDYATFSNERMPSFECRCGASNCRRTIRGEDYLTDVVSRYGDHVSDYVRRRRDGRG